MKWLKKFNENWYGADKEYDIDIDYSKFLNDINYTYSVIKKLNPELKTQWEDWFEAYTKWKKDGFPNMSDDELENMYGENPKEYESHIIENIEFYSNLYNKVKKEGGLKVYRVLNLNNISDLDYSNLGTYWSFDENPDQGFEKSDFKVYVKIYAYIKYNNIDWVNSLDNFVFYGHDESEIKAKKHTEIYVDKILVKEKSFDKNIKIYDLDGNAKESPYYKFNNNGKMIDVKKNFTT